MNTKTNIKPNPDVGISSDDFDFVRKLIRENSAVVLDKGKEYLVESRLWPVINQEGLSSIGELVQQLRLRSNLQLLTHVVDAMTTNETSFYRDVHPFEALRTIVIPTIMKNRSQEKKFNLWCGASSSGQEPYSLAMMMRIHFPGLQNWDFQFIASDISQRMLKRCRDGLYSQLEINRGLPATHLVKFFERKGMQWQIKEDIRKSIDFREVNLAKMWPIMPKMDIIMMRNVLIYFDVDTKKEILEKIRNLLKPDGYLFLGAAETTMNLNESFARVQFPQSGCYQLINS